MTKKRQKQKNTRDLVLGIFVIGLVVVVGAALFTSYTNQGGTSGVAETLNITTLAGETLNIPDEDKKATVVFAMAYWCGTCIPEARALARLKAEMGDQLQIVIVDIDPSSNAELVQQFQLAVGNNANTLHWVLDKEGVISRTYELRVLDTTIIFNNQAQETYRDAYPTDYNTLHAQLEALGL
ncbi:MAG: TlpA family protein disulfide reductase [Chloroflexi bacterium]|nr:MAG: TlpA family protein disulfide reductase [Chloroflexota bacterium]